MKKIAFLIVSRDQDGRGPRTVKFASWFENQRDQTFEKDKGKAYLEKEDMIVDVEAHTKVCLSKLDGLDRLLLSEMCMVPAWSNPRSGCL